jgi:hypothetical protein
MNKPKSTLSKSDWVKFAKGHAKANETRTSGQVVNDAERQKNWQQN